MSTWRRVAIEKLPECRDLIQEAPDISMMWVNLWCEFANAHEEPMNRDFIGRVYDFAHWSTCESEGGDVSMYAVIGFYEMLLREPLVRDEMPRWISRGDFYGLADVFKTSLNDSEFKDLEMEFLRRNDDLEREARALKKMHGRSLTNQKG